MKGQNGHIEERGPKTFRLIYDAPRGPDGCRRLKKQTFHGTKRQAQAELRRILREIDTGNYVDPVKMTFGDYLESKWLPDYAKPNVSGSHYQRCQRMVRANILPVLGHLPLDKIKPTDLQSVYSAWQESGRKDGKGGLAPKTVLNLHRLIRQSLSQAVKWELIARNPADGVRAPRPQREKMTAFDETQTAAILAAAKGKPFYLALLLGLTTGMRRGEILGLTWESVDLKNGSLAVRQSLEETKAGGLALKQPKTPHSRRVITLPSVTVDALVRHKAEQSEERRVMGSDHPDQWGGLVIAWPDGSPMRPAYLTLAFQRLARKLGLPSTRLHDLRHTHASHLLKIGVHIKAVSERLGHTSVAFTLDTYSHLLPGLQEEAARRLDAAMRAMMEE